MYLPRGRSIVLSTAADFLHNSPTSSVNTGISADKANFKLAYSNQHTNLSSDFAAKCCLEILPLIVDKKFEAKYWTLSNSAPDCYIILMSKMRCLYIEVIARFPHSQVENLHTYNFATHPLFEAKLNAYTRAKGSEKPNQNLVRSRHWDVALTMVMKIEALSSPYDKSNYLLKREYNILQYIWDAYLAKQSDIDEMTGIPMVFDWAEVPNDEFCVCNSEQGTDEIDPFGKVKPIFFPPGTNCRSTLAYMTVEKLGPNIGYLQKLVRSTHRPPGTFDLWTALKIFDQLLCRILQVHRLYVVHNDICPDNVYMGRGVTVEVVYLNNFKRAYRLAAGDKLGPTGLSQNIDGCSIRFASVAQLNRREHVMQPIDDVECAFYMLLSMLFADVLPWDGSLASRLSVDSSLAVSPNNSWFETAGAAHNPTHAISRIIKDENVRKVSEIKQRFWQSPQQLSMLLSTASSIFLGDEYQTVTIQAVVRDLYGKVKDWRQHFANGEGSYDYCTKLGQNSSQSFRNFMDLRKCVLMHFKFLDTFDIINDIMFRTKVENGLREGSLRQQPWNAIVWCFNNIEMKATDSNRRNQ